MVEKAETLRQLEGILRDERRFPGIDRGGHLPIEGACEKRQLP